jgi:hypothetical protein
MLAEAQTEGWGGVKRCERQWQTRRGEGGNVTAPPHGGQKNDDEWPHRQARSLYTENPISVPT